MNQNLRANMNLIKAGFAQDTSILNLDMGDSFESYGLLGGNGNGKRKGQEGGIEQNIKHRKGGKCKPEIKRGELGRRSPVESPEMGDEKGKTKRRAF